MTELNNPEGPFQDPADLAETPRPATLEVRPTVRSDKWMVHFDASNGETLGLGETHDTQELAERSREAWIRNMVSFLRANGYSIKEVDPHNESSEA